MLKFPNKVIVTQADKYQRFKYDLEAAFQVVKVGRGMGGFILGLCSIDWLASYYFATDTHGNEYKEFVKIFLPKYDAEQMWVNLRCRLVHNFTNNGQGFSYDFRENAPEHHLIPRPLKGNPLEKRIVLNLANFTADLEEALNSLFRVLEANPEMMRRALKRRDEVGLVVGAIETE